MHSNVLSSHETGEAQIGRLVPPHCSSLFRFRAYQPRQAQKPTTAMTVPSNRAKASPASYAATGGIVWRKTKEVNAAVTRESCCLGVMF